MKWAGMFPPPAMSSNESKLQSHRMVDNETELQQQELRQREKWQNSLENFLSRLNCNFMLDIHWFGPRIELAGKGLLLILIGVDPKTGNE